MLFSFADRTLDVERRELRHGAEPVPVEPQVFDLLVYLIQNRDRVVSKDDLIAAIWAGRLVSDSTLTSRINAVRRAVGDTGGEQRVIRTAARKGFRFVADVRATSPIRARPGRRRPRRGRRATARCGAARRWRSCPSRTNPRWRPGTAGWRTPSRTT